MQTIEATVFGTKIDAGAHAAAVKELKEVCKTLNTSLTEKNWLASDAFSFADIHMFTCLAPAF